VKIPGVQDLRRAGEGTPLRRRPPRRRALGKLGDFVHDTDPQATGVPPLDPVAGNTESEATAKILKEFVRQAQELLKAEKKANGCTLRGVASKPSIPSYEEVYGLRAAAIAVYPMYKGLAQLVGMDILGHAKTLDEQMEVLAQKLGQVRLLLHPLQVHRQHRRRRQLRRQGEADRRIRRRRPEDHGPEARRASSSPATTARRACSPATVGTPCRRCCGRRTAAPTASNNSANATALRGGLGQFEAKHLMTLALANAGRLGKYGA
jgi:2,3-bisphosphoglycerate-independent phosphoglycerate mutase